MIVCSIACRVDKVANGFGLATSLSYLLVGIGNLWAIFIDFNVFFQYYLYLHC